MNSATQTKGHFRQALQAEITKYAAVSAYLYVCFAALLLYKSSLLNSEGAGYLSHGVALGKALILGKFILIGEAVGIGTRIKAGSLLQHIVWKSVLFLVLLVLLTALEELIVGWFHDRTTAQTLAEFAARPKLELIAQVLLMLMVLLPLITAKELNKTLGEGVLRRLLLERREN